SILCAGLDPAEYEMGRGEARLEGGVNKKEWAAAYLHAVSPYCAAVKPNIQYWKNRGDMETLFEVFALAESLGLVVIDDSKLADIGSTNAAGLYFASLRAHAVTVAPFAGNLKETSFLAQKFKVGIISMCLMSNPEYRDEKRKLVPIGDDEKDSYRQADLLKIDGELYARQYIKLARDAARFAVDGLVIGAPSGKNHIRLEDLETIRHYTGDDMAVLCPGMGAQGGEAEVMLKIFGRDNVIVNVGRHLMFPKDSSSTTDDQREAARQFAAKLNTARRSL
ncbi:MAG: orotidine 5'-phosphate decarboxylase / HUMPS family protein, partial [Spirochaetota bacterium]